MKNNKQNSSRIASILQTLHQVDERCALDVLPLHPGMRFGRDYLLNLARSMGAREISSLLEAETIREKALALSRSGDQANAAVLLKQSHTLCHSADLCSHGSHAARTFQAAAESYLAYKQKHYDRAASLMCESIESSRILADDFGHDMEFRRVHLARNLLRLEVISSSPGDIVDHTIRLLQYALGVRSEWPWQDHTIWKRWRTLCLAEMLWSIDEIAATLCHLTPETLHSILNELMGRAQDLRGDNPIADHTRRVIPMWFDALASLSGDRNHALNQIELFVGEAPVEFVQLRRALMRGLSSDKVRIEQTTVTKA